ncbi:hypothetical protein [Yinghuangia soli]|uniref:LPXTG cell wall anchor domain-containing protein n=1 Tax=Yinghuangia soli TaxID=2908204 RepID=A0AA41Q593_9ACTN|nr:hypothetical protein [Yinghuangia soli]MCF2531536.1 hypothetical protein [Yinghuangia soli]
MPVPATNPAHMPRYRTHKRPALWAGAVLTLAAASTVAAPRDAAADAVTANYTCTAPVVGPVDAAVRLTLSASPAQPKPGDDVTVTWKTEPVTQLASPIAFAADTIRTTAKLTVAGAQSGTLEVASARKNAAVPANSPLPVADMTGTLKISAAGAVRITPADFSIDVLYSGRSIVIPCQAKSPPVALTIGAAGSSGTPIGVSVTTSAPATKGTATSGAASGASGADSAAGSTAGSGDLPKTGALDDITALTALGCTVFLAGAAAVVITWRRRRGAATGGPR